MSSEVEMLDRDGLLTEYVEEMAEMIHGCEEYDIEEFYNRMSEDLVGKGAYLSEEDDSELIAFLMDKSKALTEQTIAEKRQEILNTFSELGVDVTQ